MWVALGLLFQYRHKLFLPQLMFWSTMCRLKALSYMTRQIKPDHKIGSALVGHDSPTWVSQQACSFSQALNTHCDIIVPCPLTEMRGQSVNMWGRIFHVCNAVERLSQVEISQVCTLRRTLTHHPEKCEVLALTSGRESLKFTESRKFDVIGLFKKNFYGRTPSIK